MDWFENPRRECAGGALGPHQDAGFEWECQCGDSASHSSQWQLGVRGPVSDARAKRDLLRVLKRFDCQKRDHVRDNTAALQAEATS